MKLRSAQNDELADLVKEARKQQFGEKSDEMRERAKQYILKAQKEKKRGFNKKRKEASKYQIGDIVTIRRTLTQPGLKLCIKFFGLYWVVAVGKHDYYKME